MSEGARERGFERGRERGSEAGCVRARARTGDRSEREGREGIGSGARGSVRRTPRSVVLAGEVRGSTGRVEEGGRPIPERARESA